MKKIIHLSDLHVGSNNTEDYGGQRLDDVFEKIVTNLIDSPDVEANATVVVITGDLAHRAKKMNYENIRKQLGRLKTAKFEIFIVPGNHDYSRKAHRYYKERLSIFIEELKNFIFQDEYFSKNPAAYPDLRIIDEETDGSIALIGLDSFEGRFSSGKTKVKSGHGEFGKDQLMRLEKMLSLDRVRQCSKRVLCFHHHLFDEDDNPDVDEWDTLHEFVTKEGVFIDALLYGHKHHGKAGEENWGIRRWYDGSSSTGRKYKPKHKKYEVRQRLIDLSVDDPNEGDYDLDYHK